jgi:hypothetical protein
MTEAEWLASSDLNAMLEHLGEQISPRKLRLFACACCRRVWDLLHEPACRQAVVVAERFADGLATKEELMAARNEAVQQGPGSSAAQVAARDPRWAAAWTAVGASKIAAWAAAKNSERSEQAALLREIVGNPFLPPPETASWPPEIVSLAEAQYAGKGDHFALCDALADAGHPELAEHFGTPGHPKGCWALDLILGKS